MSDAYEYTHNPMYSHLSCNIFHESSNFSNEFHHNNNIAYQGHKGLTWSEVVEACEEYERNSKPQKASKSDMVIGLLFLLLLPLIGYLPFFIKSLE